MSRGNRILLYTAGSILAGFLVKSENALALCIVGAGFIGICEIAFRMISERRKRTG